MQAFPLHLLDEAMHKLGNIMQNRSLARSCDRDLSGCFDGLPCADEILPQVYLYIGQGHWVT